MTLKSARHAWQDHRNTVDELLSFHGIATVSSGELADEELVLAELLVDDSPAGKLLERELQELRRIEARAVGAYGAARSRTPMPRPCAVNRWRPRWRSSRRASRCVQRSGCFPRCKLVTFYLESVGALLGRGALSGARGASGASRERGGYDAGLSRVQLP